METPADRGAPAIVPAGVAEEEVMKIASNINKLDNSVNQLNKRCNTLHEEFLTQRDALQEQLQTLPAAAVPNTGINPLERNLPQEIRNLHEFHESKMQELQSISEEIKHLQEGLSTVKAASSELFDKYHIRPTVFLDQQESSTTKTPLTDSFPDSIPRLEQYAFNDHRIKLIQSDIMELREKIEQIYYLSLSAVSVAQGRHEAPPRIKQDEEKKLQVSFHHLSFPENNPKKETKSSLPPRPSVSASSTRKKPNLHHGNQRPNSSTGISRALTSSENLLTPPSVSFVDTIEPPIRPPRNPVAPVHRIAVNSRPKSQPQQSTPLQQQLLLLAGGSLTENSVTSGVLIPPFDDLRIGESNSSVWERDLSLSPNNQSEINNLPHALLYGSLTVRDAVKYDKENDHDETWYRSYQLPSGNALRVSGISDSSRPQGTEQGGYVSSLAEYTGNWKVPSFVNN